VHLLVCNNNQTEVSFTNVIILQIHNFILKSPTTKMIPTLTHFGTTWDTNVERLSICKITSDYKMIKHKIQARPVNKTSWIKQ
jgi:hypothetical protein